MYLHRSPMLPFLWSAVALLVFLCPQNSWPAPSTAPAVTKPAEPQAASDDPLGRSTPYGTVMGFIRAAERDDYQRAARYLESKHPARKKEELASALKVVLDRAVVLDL